VITEREKIGKLESHYQENKFKMRSAVFALNDVAFIPFFSGSPPEDRKAQVKTLTERLRKFLQFGFYFSYNMDLTSNLQRRVLADCSWQEPNKAINEKFMWNYELYSKFRVQAIPEHWYIPLVQGYVGFAECFQGGLEITVALI